LAISGLFLWKASAAKAARSLPAVAMPAGAVGSSSQAVRILPGLKSGSYTDRFGRVWQADHDFQDGTMVETTGHTVIGTRDQRLFSSRREGTFTYNIPLPPGVYELRLYFAENLYGENNMAGGGETSRIFNVYANSIPILQDFDVVREVGASAADIRAFKDLSPASDGKLHLKFEQGNNPAMVSAIEITPGMHGRMMPIRLVSRDLPYTDREGHIWAPDTYSRGGLLVMRTEPMTNIDDPDLLDGERYGNISYTIPVPPGRYGVNMYFAESWFGPGQPANGGVGSRIFDILCNGVALKRGFDIFKEAHGSDKALIVPVHGLEPDAQGRLVISLLPVRNYASINAVEVIDESK
jgi:Malectin domain